MKVITSVNQQQKPKHNCHFVFASLIQTAQFKIKCKRRGQSFRGLEAGDELAGLHRPPDSRQSGIQAEPANNGGHPKVKPDYGW